MIIKCEGIIKDYNKKMRALKGVDLEIPAGVFGLIGRNGAGKTTLLRIMASVLTATQGKVFFDGKPMDDHLAEYRSMLGYLPQN
ncbi:MAG: ATP-binding cassette domain-containing protein, partial [Clostridia bacterium]|nr:ATP-binding cassette domain-containing protein [Clostridia bacterium]